MKRTIKILFPFFTKRYHFLENIWRHRLLKFLFYIILIWVIIFTSFLIKNKSEFDEPIFENIKFGIFNRSPSIYYWFTDEATIFKIELTKKGINQDEISNRIQNIPKSLQEIPWNINNYSSDVILYHTGKNLIKYKFLNFLYYIQLWFIVLLITYMTSILLQIIYYKWIIYIIYGSKKHEK